MKQISLFLSFLIITILSFSQNSNLHSRDTVPQPVQDSIHHDTVFTKKIKVAVFSNLYLDSAYDETGYRFAGNVPAYILPGLEFAEGVQYALDTLQSEGEDIEVDIHDMRSVNLLSILKVLNYFDSVHLIIGAVSGMDFVSLSDIAKEKNIPFISSIYPNAAGTTMNPFVFIANPTLATHCDAIHEFLLRKFPTDNIIYLRKKGPVDDRIYNEIVKQNSLGSGNYLLHINYIDLDTEFSGEDILPYLDSNRTNVIVAGSIDDVFGLNVARFCLEVSKTYPVHLIGMPTWESIREFNKKEFRPLNIYYSTPFYNAGRDSLGKRFAQRLFNTTFGAPTDMASKGFECTWNFIHLLVKYKHDFINHVNDKSYQVFTEFNFKPVSRDNTIPDYFENKRIYILRHFNGTISKAN